MQLFKWKYFLPAVMLFASCKKNLDINTDPNNPTDISVSQLLPTAEKGLGDGVAISNDGVRGGLSDILSVFVHQTIQRSEFDKYGVTGNSFDLSADWPGLYQTTLSNLEVIINKATADDNAIYSGIAKVLKAYTY